jgi:hypothetical protein
MEVIMRKDLENERQELLRIIKENTDEPLRRLLALVPEPPGTQQVTVTTSTKGTGYASTE